MTPNLMKTERYLKTVVDAMPSAIFLVDENFNFVDLNPAASALFKLKSDAVLHRLCGEVLHCKNAIHSETGCGTTELCPDCVLRNSVESAYAGGKTYRKKYKLEIEHEGAFSELHFLVSASPIRCEDDQFVLMVIEDVTELTMLKRLFPICSHCKKIRNDKEYWVEVEDFLHKHADMTFTHSICPYCKHKHYSDFGF